MMSNDNVVTIKTEDKETRRKILELLREKIGVTLFATDDGLELQGSIYNEIITEVIRKVIMKDMSNVVINPRNNEKAEEQEIDSSTPIQKEDNSNKPIGEQIFSFMQSKNVVTNAEIIRELNLSADTTWRELRQLCEHGKIEKIRKGHWKIKGTKETSDLTLKEQQEKENVEEVKSKEELEEIHTNDEIIKENIPKQNCE